MPIKGLTDQQAALPIIGQLRKGAPKPDRGPGQDLEYFRFTSDDPATVAQFYDNYPKEPKSINVFLPHPTTDENMDSWIELWVAGGLVYRSDGESIVLWQDKGQYRTDPKPDPKPDEGEDGKRQDNSSQVGRLSVIVPEMGRLATITVLTTSKHDIINLTRQLRSYESLRGDLRGIPFVLSRRPKAISTPGKNGKRIRREKWLLSIETQPKWTMAMLSSMERDALPEPIQESEYYLPAPAAAQLPTGVFDPFSDPGDTPSPEPPPNIGRPFTPELCRAHIDALVQRKQHTMNGTASDPASDKAIGLLAGKLNEVFAGDDADKKRRSVIKYLFGLDSSKDMTKAQVSAGLEWLIDHKDESTGDYVISQLAAIEAAGIERQYLVDAGQQEIAWFDEETE